jgi:hypothetical protein
MRSRTCDARSSQLSFCFSLLMIQNTNKNDSKFLQIRLVSETVATTCYFYSMAQHSFVDTVVT